MKSQTKLRVISAPQSQDRTRRGAHPVTQLGLSAVQTVERLRRLGRIIRERIAAMSEIKERLRASICGDKCRFMEARLGCECAEAADTIEALRAENERLREQRDEFTAWLEETGNLETYGEWEADQ